MAGIDDDIWRLVEPFVWCEGSTYGGGAEAPLIRFEKMPAINALALLALVPARTRRYRHNKAPSMYEMVMLSLSRRGLKLGGYLTTFSGKRLVAFDTVWVDEPQNQVLTALKTASENCKIGGSSRFWWD